MSTKIYNGLRLKIDGLGDLHEKVTEWRATVAKLQLEHDAKITAQFAASKIDDAAMKDEVVYGAVHAVGWEIHDRRREVEKTQRRDPLIDTEFTLVVMPYPAGDMILAIAYSERQDWIKQFRALPWVEEYGYWNNTDKPDEVSDEEWEEREKAWTAATKSDPLDRPGAAGFTIECLPHHVFVDPKECVPHLPTYEGRVERIVHNKSFNEWSQRNGVNQEKLMESFFTHMDNHKKWAKTDEGIAVQADLRAHVQSKLKPDLTEDDLQRHRNSDA